MEYCLRERTDFSSFWADALRVVGGKYFRYFSGSDFGRPLAVANHVSCFAGGNQVARRLIDDFISEMDRAALRLRDARSNAEKFVEVRRPLVAALRRGTTM